MRAVLALMDGGATVPFIARYRKEQTGGLDEVELRSIAETRARIDALEDRREAVLSSIEEQGKLTPDLRRAIEACRTRAELEDVYLPFRPKRRMWAQAARERGLEPLALRILAQPRDGDPTREKEEALAGARDIASEIVSERADVRSLVRQRFAREGRASFMSATMRKRAVASAFVGAVLVACGGQTGIGSPLSAVIGNAACPELRGGAMNATFDEDARANATVRTFVTAAGDLADVAARARAEVFTACERMADDLDIPQSERRGIRNDDDNAVTSACGAVAARIDAIMKQGASASLRADVTPPQCHVNGQAEAACKAQCNAQGSARGTAQGQAQDSAASGAAAGSARAQAHCNGSCKAHADLTAHCTEAQVRIQGNVNTGEMAKVAATLQRNLPPLIKAQVAYGQRIADDVQILVRTGADLPDAVGHLSARAGACVAAAANATVAAQASLRVSVQASASVTAKAGANP